MSKTYWADLDKDVVEKYPKELLPQDNEVFPAVRYKSKTSTWTINPGVAKRTAVVAAAKGVKTLHADSYREAADALLDRVQPGDAVLVKASHGMALEKVLDIFYEEHKETEV